MKPDPLPEDLSDRKLSELLFPSDRSKSEYKMPDYEYVHRELQKNGVTLNLLWLEYCEKSREEGALPYQLTQFKKHYRDYAIKTNVQNVTVTGQQGHNTRPARDTNAGRKMS